jgi:hypothetical protein
MPSIVQRSFAGGEIAPELYGRADMVKYTTGLATCKNFIVQKHGGVANAPGTKFIGQAAGDNTDQYPPNLIKFILNNNVTFVLEFSDQKMRVINNGEFIVSGGSIYELATPFTADEVNDIKYAQTGDVVTLVHPNHPPKELKRLADDNWTIEDIVFGPQIDPPGSVTASPSESFPPDTYFNRYNWAVTAISEDGSEESLVAYSGPLFNLPSVGSNDFSVSLSIARVDDAREYNVYRSENGSAYYLIGIADQPNSGDAGFTDRGQLDNEDVTPPKPREIFNESGEYPSTVTFYQQRRVFAATENDPQKVWMSRAGAYSNFNTSSPVRPDDPVIFTVAGRRFNRIQNLVNIGKLIILTSEGEWLAAGDQDGAITPTTINLQQQGYSGARDIDPIIVANNALYVQSRGSIIKNLVYQFETDGYAGQDLTIFANHFFRDYLVSNWDYQQTPDSVVWVVRNDGKLLGLTYLPEHSLWGWHQHTTDGDYERVCVIPEGNEDRLYAIVKREIEGVTVRYIERFEPRIDNDVRDSYFVHCGLSFDGRNTGSGTMTAVYESQNEVILQDTTLGFSESDVGNGIFIYYEGRTVRFDITEYISSNQVRANSSEDVKATGIDKVAVTTWARAYDEFSGLDHLEGKVVSVLADGMVISDGQLSDTSAERFRVSNGKIKLASPQAVVHIGLPYTADFQTLRLEIVGNETLLNRKKNINKVYAFVESSRGIFAGRSFDDLTEFKQRRSLDKFEAQSPETDLFEINIGSKWEEAGQVCMRQKDPLPLTILSVIPTGQVGGK